MSEQNEFSETTPKVPPLVTKPFVPPPPPRTTGYWLRVLLVCNPFYLASACLLLYGVYRISSDPNFLATEVGQLTFNFSALQLYELLLAGTAMALVTRRIWYDATLLVVLENLLWIVPFILVSQAALINRQTTWMLCLLAAGLAVGRTLWLRWRAGQLMPSWRALLCGSAVLAMNAALPIVYRHYQETKKGAWLETEPAWIINDAVWFWVFPALALVANLLPRPENDQRDKQVARWFPMMLCLFWIVATGVHLYALGYVYDFPLRREQLTPVLWVLAWTLVLRIADFVPAPSNLLRRALLTLPLLTVFVSAFVVGSHVFLVLAILNFIAFGVVLILERDNRFALQLAMISFASMISALPVEVVHPVVGGFDRMNLIGGAVLAYLAIATALSRNPKLAIVGAVAAAIAGGLVREGQTDSLHWAMQAGFVYALLHSLRWRDYEHQGAAVARIAIASLWVLHAFICARAGVAFVPLFVVAALVLCVWAARGFLFQIWRPMVIPITAGLVTLCHPMNFVVMKTQTTPVGLLAVIGSFVLFAFGTVAALTKHRWHKVG
ncbi:MAG TPA: hypothetical protein VFZ59_25160 [Verrucomicrobiae bacterium]|nr:hypothetical protein [Verrucomicrobiae bacterium]